MKNYSYSSFIASLILIWLCACKKDPASTVKTFPPASYPFACQDTAFDWTPFKPDPFGLVYHYSSSTGNKAIWRAAYDTKDANIIYFITDNNLYRFDRSSHTRTLLDVGALNEFSISNTGWIAYQKTDLNIYIIKTNGDSLHAITTKSNYFYPTWTDDGKAVYIGDQTEPPGMTVLIDKKGVVMDSLKTILTGRVFQINNYLYYYDASTTSSIYRKDLTTQENKLIVTDNNGFLTLFTNKANTALYYNNNSGLYTVNLFTLKVEKMINSGYGSRSDIHHFAISNVTGEFLGVESRDYILPSDTSTIIEEGNIWEFSSDGKCRQKIALP